MICIQETKKETIDKCLCQALWGDSVVRWEAQPANNTAGGILCMWSKETFKLQDKVIGGGFIYLRGFKEDQQVHIVCIYSPCDIQNKRLLWETIKQLRNPHNGGLWSILGDFNNVRHPAERTGNCHRGDGDSSIKEFNDWIDDLEVEDAGQRYQLYPFHLTL